MRRLSVSLLIILQTFLLGCSQETAKPMRLGTNIWPGYEPLYLARDLGYLQPSVRLIEYPSASEVLRAFRNKSLEAASLTLDEVLLLRQLHIPVTIVLIHDISAGADVIIAKPDITAMEDLKHKRIGVESGALGAFVISRALELTGLTTADVDIKVVDVNRHQAVFNDGEVDAVVTFEPVRTKLLAAGGNEIFTSKEMPGEIVDVLVVHRDYLAEHPDVIQHLVDGWFQALAYMKSDSGDAQARIARRLRINAEQVAASYQGLLLPDQADNIALLGGDTPQLTEGVFKLNQTMISMGLLDIVINTQGLLEPQFIEESNQP